MQIEKVLIYPSLYGIEQMKKDALYGPPKELFESNKKVDEIKAKKRDEKREFESDDEFRLDEKDDGK